MMARVKYLLPLGLWLLALCLVAGVLSQLPLRAITAQLQALSWTQYALWVSLNVAIMLVATGRWWLFSRSMRAPVRFIDLLRLRQAGQTLSFITPGPQFGGEPLQLYWLCAVSKQPLARALLALGLDRFYELWTNASVLLLSVLLLFANDVQPFAAAQNGLVIAILLLLTLGVSGGWLYQRPESILAWLTRLTERWHKHPRLQALVTHWQADTIDIRDLLSKQQPTLLAALWLSGLGWLLLLAELWLLLDFLALPVTLNAFLVILVVMRLAFLLPLPGGIGTLEAALFWAFQYLHWPASSVLGLIAMMRGRDALVLLFGLLCMQTLKFRR
jgi:uncharacterized protein (TIRG00374 family)